MIKFFVLSLCFFGLAQAMEQKQQKRNSSNPQMYWLEDSRPNASATTPTPGSGPSPAASSSNTSTKKPPVVPFSGKGYPLGSATPPPQEKLDEASPTNQISRKELLDLPDELKLHILSFLDERKEEDRKALISFGQAGRETRRLYWDDSLMRSRLVTIRGQAWNDPVFVLPPPLKLKLEYPNLQIAGVLTQKDITRWDTYRFVRNLYVTIGSEKAKETAQLLLTRFPYLETLNIFIPNYWTEDEVINFRTQFDSRTSINVLTLEDLRPGNPFQVSPPSPTPAPVHVDEEGIMDGLDLGAPEPFHAFTPINFDTLEASLALRHTEIAAAREAAERAEQTPALPEERNPRPTPHGLREEAFTFQEFRQPIIGHPKDSRAPLNFMTASYLKGNGKKFLELDESGSPDDQQYLFLLSLKLNDLLQEALNFSYLPPNAKRNGTDPITEKREEFQESVATALRGTGIKSLKLLDLLRKTNREQQGRIQTPDSYYNALHHAYELATTCTSDPNIDFNRLLKIVEGVEPENRYACIKGLNGYGENLSYLSRVLAYFPGLKFTAQDLLLLRSVLPKPGEKYEREKWMSLLIRASQRTRIYKKTENSMFKISRFQPTKELLIHLAQKKKLRTRYLVKIGLKKTAHVAGKTALYSAGAGIVLGGAAIVIAAIPPVIGIYVFYKVGKVSIKLTKRGGKLLWTFVSGHEDD